MDGLLVVRESDSIEVSEDGKSASISESVSWPTWQEGHTPIIK